MIGILWLAISGVGLPLNDHAVFRPWSAAPRAKRVTWRYPFESNRRYGRRRGRRRRGGPPLPKVDFRKRSLVAAFQGTMGSTNSGIEIKRVVESKREVVVFVTLAKAMSSCVSYAMMTSPWHMVAIPRRKKPHRFVVNYIDACTHRGR